VWTINKSHKGIQNWFLWVVEISWNWAKVAKTKGNNLGIYNSCVDEPVGLWASIARVVRSGRCVNHSVVGTNPSSSFWYGWCRLPPPEMGDRGLKSYCCFLLYVVLIFLGCSTLLMLMLFLVVVVGGQMMVGGRRVVVVNQKWWCKSQWATLRRRKIENLKTLVASFFLNFSLIVLSLSLSLFFFFARSLVG
jgi:hypothetical protein